MLHISACTFKRTKISVTEKGVAFIAAPGLSDVSVIVDAMNKVVSKQPWTYALTSYLGAMSIDLT